MTDYKKYDENQIKEIPIQQILNDFGIPFSKDNKFKALWRNENNPSVSFKNNCFNDFGGDKKGSVIDLFMVLANCNFHTAVNSLGDKYLQNESNASFKKIEKKRDFTPATKPQQNPQSITPLNFNFSDIYRSLVELCPLKGKGSEYLKGRALDTDLLTLYGFGYITGEKNDYFRISNHLKKHFSVEDLKSAGLFNENGKFKGYGDSIIIPYFDNSNKISTLQFRFIDPEDKVKYRFLKDIPRSPFFLDSALDTLNEKNTDEHITTIITEGVFDFLAGLIHLPNELNSTVTGFALGSATSTNLITDEQIKVIIAKSDSIIFCLDRDTAGDKALDELNLRIKTLGGTDNQVRSWVPGEGIKDLNQHFIIKTTNN